MDFDEFPEPTAIVISHGFCVPKSLEYRVRCKNNRLNTYGKEQQYALSGTGVTSFALTFQNSLLELPGLSAPRFTKVSNDVLG